MFSQKKEPIQSAYQPAYLQHFAGSEQSAAYIWSSARTGIVANAQSFIGQAKNGFKGNYIARQADGMHLCSIDACPSRLFRAMRIFKGNFQMILENCRQFFRQFACGPTGRVNFRRAGIINNLPGGQVLSGDQGKMLRQRGGNGKVSRRAIAPTS